MSMRITLSDEKHGLYSFATDLTFVEVLNALRDKATYLKMPLEKYPIMKDEEPKKC